MVQIALQRAAEAASKAMSKASSESMETKAVHKKQSGRARTAPSIIKTLSCLLLLTSNSAQAQDTSTPGQQSSSTQTRTAIRGGVNLDETLPPVPDAYQVGNQITDAQLQGQTPDNMWYPIPNWLAGKWHSETKLIDYIQDCKTGASQSPHMVVKEVDSAVHGHQRDKTGRIWEFIKVPEMRKVGLAHGNAYIRAVRKDILESDPSEVIVKILSNQITVSDKDQQIVESNQVQQIGTYTQLDEGLVQLTASLRNFDNDGAPIQMQKQSLTMTRTAPYADVDTLNGLDLKKNVFRISDQKWASGTCAGPACEVTALGESNIRAD